MTRGGLITGSHGLLSLVIRWVAAATLFVLLATMLADGRIAGDESVIYRSAMLFHESGSGLLNFLAGNDSYYISHHVLWLVEKIVFIYVADGIAWLTGYPFLTSYFASLDSVVAIILAITLCVRYLRQNGPSALAGYAVSLFWLGGFGASFLTGGMVECLMAPLIALRLFYTDRRSPLLAAGAALLGLVDAALIGFKPYAGIFIIATLPIIPWGENWRCRFAQYVCALGAALAVVAVLKMAAGNPAEVAMLATPDVAAMAQRLRDEFFSLSFGLVWCAPLLLVVFGVPPELRRRLAWKLVALFLLLVLLSGFPFWHGAAGIAGPRYVFPFLIAFLPEFAAGLAAMVGRWPRLVFVACLLPVAFLPTIDYRNSLFSHYGSRGAEFEVGWADFPHYDLRMHPAVFAWRVVIAEVSGAPRFRPESGRLDDIPMREMSPSSGLSRVGYILATRPVEASAHIGLLERMGVADRRLWQGLRVMAYGGAMAAVLLLALRVHRRRGGQGTC